MSDKVPGDTSGKGKFLMWGVEWPSRFLLASDMEHFGLTGRTVTDRAVTLLYELGEIRGK